MRQRRMMAGKEDDLGLRLRLSLSSSCINNHGFSGANNTVAATTTSGVNRIFQISPPPAASSSSSTSPPAPPLPLQLNLMMVPPSSSSSFSSSAPPPPSAAPNSSLSLLHNPFAASLHKTPAWNDINPFHHFSADRASDTTRVATTTIGFGAALPRTYLREMDVNRLPASNNADDDDDDAGASSPNSTISSVCGKRCEREAASAAAIVAAVSAGSGDDERTCSRGGGGGGSDEEDGDTSRKKLRLSKDQSAILEESFKEHNTLDPKQKLALAKRLGLRPRQVEVWFQNRRARTKLKQTEVDCEFLKRCCEQLTEENRRLQRKVQELRALKLSPQFYMQMTPPTTLTMCPSCERVPPPPPASASSASKTGCTNAATPPVDARPSGRPAGAQNFHHHHRAASDLALNPWGVTAPVPIRPFEALQPRS